MRVHRQCAVSLLFVVALAISSDYTAAEDAEPIDVTSTNAITAVLSDSRVVVAAGIDPMLGTMFEQRLTGAFRKAVLTGPVVIEPLVAGSQPDRHGREPVLILSRGEPVQLYLLRSGLTRYVGFNGQADVEMRQKFLAAEAEARLEQKGLWRDPWYVVFMAETVPLRHGFAIVEGAPIEIAHTRSMVYLNFGDDWRTDFTVGVEPRILKTDAWSEWSIDTLIGKPIRIRGWMRPYNGAFMTLTNPDQIEILGR